MNSHDKTHDETTVGSIGASDKRTLWSWLFEDTFSNPNELNATEKLDWSRILPFAAIHVACLSVIWVGISPIAIIFAILFYVIRMFAITGFYHRYFSHRTFKTSRPVQFLMACVACTAGQRGPLWWAGHHRWHHKHSDQDQDIHSPSFVGFVRSHMGWFLTKSAFGTPKHLIKDWYRYPELRLINRLDWVPFIGFGFACYFLGVGLNHWFPALGTNGPQMLVYGFFISTIVLYHATYTINSLAHRFGKRRYNTKDDSRNNFWLALLTMGEGWHNNHHHYPASTRQGFFWWEVDITYYILRGMGLCGLIWNLNPVTQKALERNRVDDTRSGA